MSKEWFGMGKHKRLNVRDVCHGIITGTRNDNNCNELRFVVRISAWGILGATRSIKRAESAATTSRKTAFNIYN